MARPLFAIIWKKCDIFFIAPKRTHFSTFGDLNNNTTTKYSQEIYVIYKMAGILSSLGCERLYSPIYFQLIDYNKNYDYVFLYTWFNL